jgi:ATP-dependent protease ClpP protease subunit
MKQQKPCDNFLLAFDAGNRYNRTRNLGDNKMGRYILISILVLFSLAVDVHADTFKHRETSEVFHGFATQKTNKNETLVYVAEQKKFKPVNLGEYNITFDFQGRRDSVAVVRIRQQEVILSHAVTTKVAEAVIKASNKGPRFIILEIDCPGGRGDYMKNITTALAKTKNCRTVAFISSEKYGGAYSVAASIALACDKIYISPDAVMGAVSPMYGQTDEDLAEHITTFSANALAGFRGYMASLAEKNNRPVVLAQAIVDRNIEVIEVKRKDGTTFFIDKTQKKPNDAIIRVLTRTGKTVDGGTYTDYTQQSSAAVGDSVYLTLTANDAVKSKMADGTAGSLAEVLEDMGAADAHLVNAGAIEKTVKKFVAGKRNIKRFLASIDYLQGRSEELRQYLKDLGKQQRESTVTHQYERGSTSRRTRGNSLVQQRNLRNRQQNFYEPRSKRNRRQVESDIFVESRPVVNPAQIIDELAFVLADLIRDYRKVIVLARRFPGALPAGISLSALQQKLESAVMMQNNLQRDLRLIPAL